MARRARVYCLIDVQKMIIFFFQAEDGIRDHCVTGVQTCALPIYTEAAEPVRFGSVGGFRIRGPEVISPAPAPGLHRRGRSEERRVGKECRSRWSPNY